MASPTCTPSASAKLRSMTTSPLRIQVPAVSEGSSSDTGASSRPSSTALVVIPCALTSANVSGYGPLCAVTPGARSSAAKSVGLASAVIDPLLEKVGDRLATTSGPLVAARVVL